MGYGVLVTHLHNDRQLAPFQVEGIMKPSYNWSYLVFWGMAGVGLGSLLPWVDTIWEDTSSNPELASEKERLSTIEDENTGNSTSGLGADWNPVVRSIGAFVGIAFAIVSSHTFTILDRATSCLGNLPTDYITAQIIMDIYPPGLPHACPC
jgi:hypothetical protein